MKLGLKSLSLSEFLSSLCPQCDDGLEMAWTFLWNATGTYAHIFGLCNVMAINLFIAFGS